MGVALRFAILTRDATIERWLAEAVERAAAQGAAECVAFVTPSKSLPRFGTDSIAAALRSPKHWAYFLLRKTALRTAFGDDVNVSDVVPDVQRMRVDVVTRGATTRLAQRDVDELVSLDLDFILLGEFGILKGDVLNAARHGVWSFHHGDPRAYRGRPSCFWELHDGEEFVRAGIQRLNETLDGGHFMRLATVAARPSFTRTMSALYEASTTLLASGCHEVITTQRLPEAIELPSPLPPLRSRPTNGAVMRAAARVGLAAIRRAARGLFVRRDWEIGVAQAEDATEPWSCARDLGLFSWSRPHRRRTFWADPHIVDGDEGAVMSFAEEFDYRAGYGRIVLLRFEKGRLVERSVVLDDGHHHAFPQIIRSEGWWYATTDTCCEAGAIYRFEALGDQWRPLDRARAPADLTDPVLFRYNEAWVALGTDRRHDSGSWCTAYETTELGTGWTPIVSFPLFVDATSARGGGTVDIDRKVRAVQMVGSRYGDASSLIRLDDRFWLGSPTPVLPAGSGGEIAGAHTVSWSPSGQWIAVDRCRYRLDPLAWRYRLIESKRRKACRAGNSLGEG